MKTKLLKSIDSFVLLLFTFGKVGYAEWAKNNFPKMVNNLWEEDKSDADNIKNIEEQFNLNKTINELQGNVDAVKCIDAFLEGWFVDVKKML